VVADRMRLGQVLTNLIGNAVKFCNRGEIVVAVSSGAVEAGKLNLSFSVSDTGIGMAPDKVDGIFQPFSQADASTTRRFGGTGLGLTISASLAKLMGGRLWVESREGQGSTFHVTIRIDAPQTESIPGCGAPRVASGLAGDNRRLLVADDNDTCRKVLVGLLHRWGLDPVEAADGMEALALLRAAPRGSFRAALLDADMPGASGWEIAETIAAEQIAARAIVMAPISARRTQAPGVAIVVTKPLCGRDLWQALGVGAAREETATSRAADSTPNPIGEQTNLDRQGLRILLAEDNPVNQIFAQRLLENNGHRVTLAMDGEAALSALERDTFDIVLMDVQMPLMDGLEAARRVRQRERSTNSHIPIIAMTAHAMSGDREICLKAGMDGYVSKPIDPRELFAAIAGATRIGDSSSASRHTH